MLQNEIKTQGDISLRLFNQTSSSMLFNQQSHATRDSNPIEILIAQKNIKNKKSKLDYKKMVKWLTEYVNCPEFLATYSDNDNRSIELVAEATFYSVNLGLDEHFLKMSYSEIREFQLLNEMLLLSEREKLIRSVLSQLKKPAIIQEAQYAMGQAAWCIYIHHYSYKKLQEENEAYPLMKSMKEFSEKITEGPQLKSKL